MSTLDDTSRAAFVAAYSKLLVTSWTDPAFTDLLLADPHTVLADLGINLPAGTEVTVVPVPATDLDPTAAPTGTDAQYELFESSCSGGDFTLYLPEPPRVDLAELSASELHGVAAGGIWDPYCCSCCPSCCSAAGYGG